MEIYDKKPKSWQKKMILNQLYYETGHTNTYFKT